MSDAAADSPEALALYEIEGMPRAISCQDAALKRAVRLADGYFPGEGDFEQLKALITRLRNTAEENDRDPQTIAINAMFGAQMANPAEGVEQMASIGVDRIMIPAFFFAGPDGLDRLSALGETIIPLAQAS